MARYETKYYGGTFFDKGGEVVKIFEGIEARLDGDITQDEPCFGLINARVYTFKEDTRILMLTTKERGKHSETSMRIVGSKESVHELTDLFDTKLGVKPNYGPEPVTTRKKLEYYH